MSWLVASMLILGACKGDSAPHQEPSAAAVAPAAQPASRAETAEPALLDEVTIASVPAGASVRLQGAELGKTPYELKLKSETTVEVALAGYESRELVVRRDGEPNLVVKLVADPTQEGAAADDDEKEGDDAAADEADEQPAAKPAPAGPLYPNVTAAKSAYRAGRIDRGKYDQIIRRLKTKRKTKIDYIKKLYKAGSIDRDEYNRRKRVIDTAYEG